MGVDFELPSTALSEMHFYSFAYFDALTKDLFVQKVLLVLRAASLSVQAIARSFMEAGGPPDAASNLLRLVPSARGPLTRSAHERRKKAGEGAETGEARAPDST